eukprot:scaffold32287_cov36-Phaeocystis_antarctica.AAC.1
MSQDTSDEVTMWVVVLKVKMKNHRAWTYHGITARSAFCDTVKVASAGTSVRACSMYPRRSASRGTITLKPRIF